MPVESTRNLRDVFKMYRDWCCICQDCRRTTSDTSFFYMGTRCIVLFLLMSYTFSNFIFDYKFSGDETGKSHTKYRGYCTCDLQKKAFFSIEIGFFFSSSSFPQNVTDLFRKSLDVKTLITLLYKSFSSAHVLIKPSVSIIFYRMCVNMYK